MQDSVPREDIMIYEDATCKRYSLSSKYTHGFDVVWRALEDSIGAMSIDTSQNVLHLLNVASSNHCIFNRAVPSYVNLLR